jgi:glycosyltransferase involved in cell wall biosynthesis
VLFVGVLDHSARYKGLDYLLDAIRLLVDRGIDVHLEVAGDGDAAADYAARTKQLGLSVHVQFLGAVDRSQIGDVYRRTTVLAVPSTFENFPTVAVEAMACAKPVVATRVGSVGDVVDDGRTGVLVEPGDVVQLADALQWVLANPAAGVKMGAAGRDRVVAELTVRRQAERTAATFDEVLAPSPRRPKKVAVLTPYYSPSIGGVQHYAEKLAAALASSPEFDPVVVTTHRGHRTVVEELGGVMVVRLGTLLTLSNTPVNPAWFWQLRRLMLELGIDVVNAHAPVPGLADVAALTSPRPVVLTYHSGTMQKRDWTDRAVRFYERYVLPRVFDRCASLVAVSPISLCYRTGRSMLISPGVDVEIFVPAASARNCSLLYVGRVERSSRWKGIHVLLAALGQVAKTLPEVVLDVVGTGDAVPEMRAIAAELGVGDRVRWHGALPHRAVVPFYQQAGVLALPSLTNAESFGMVLIEAMATGCPVVGSDVGGIPFVIRDGVDGLLVPPGDAAALAHACLTILQDGRLASRMSEAGRAAAEERWTWSRQTEALMAIFRDVVPRPAIGWHLTATARGQ